MRNQLTQDAPTLFVDQYGSHVVARSAKELLEKAGGSKASKQYVDTKDGRTLWTGYVVGRRWFTAFRYAEVECVR
jgi:hypothetical protein